MGAAASGPEQQLALVTLPPAKTSVYGVIALVPMRRRYFATEESLAPLFDLFQSERVRATFTKSRPTPTLQEFYNRWIVATEAAVAAAVAQGDPHRAVPVVALGRRRQCSDSWSWVGMLSCRDYAIDGSVPSPRQFSIVFFKEYTGASAISDSDLAMSLCRGVVAQFAAGSGFAADSQKPLRDIRWPYPIEVTFTVDNSGTAGVFSRMFKYCAMHGPQDMCTPVTFTTTKRDDIEFHVATMEEHEGVQALCNVMAGDPTVLISRQPSLRASEPALLQCLGVDDESFYLINMLQRTNDSNFPSNARTKDNTQVMDVAARLKEIHDDCKARAHSLAAQYPAKEVVTGDLDQLLFHVFGLHKPPTAVLQSWTTQTQLALLVLLSADAMRTPLVSCRAAAVNVARTMIGAETFELLFGADPARRELMVQASERNPWLVITGLIHWRNGSGGQAEEALAAAVRAVLPRSDGVVDTNTHVECRMVDLKLRDQLPLPTFEDAVVALQGPLMARLQLSPPDPSGFVTLKNLFSAAST